MRERECLKNRWLCAVLHADLNFMTMFFSAKSINTWGGVGGKEGAEEGREVRRGMRMK